MEKPALRRCHAVLVRESSLAPHLTGIRSRSLALSIVLLAVAATAGNAQLSPAYLDASGGVGGNTARASDSHPTALFATPANNADSLWGAQTYGQSGTSYEASTTEDAPPDPHPALRPGPQRHLPSLASLLVQHLRERRDPGWL